MHLFSPEAIRTVLTRGSDSSTDVASDVLPFLTSTSVSKEGVVISDSEDTLPDVHADAFLFGGKVVAQKDPDSKLNVDVGEYLGAGGSCFFKLAPDGCAGYLKPVCFS